MAEIRPSEIRKIFRPKDAYEDDILWAIAGGRDELTGYVGAAAVMDYLLDSPTDAIRADALKRAHGHFTYAVLVSNQGSTLREGGRVTRETIGEGDDIEYASAAEIERLAEIQRELGRKACALYLPTGTSAYPTAVVVRG